MHRGRLICLVGLDGAGKTTVGKLLSARAGYRYVWGNIQPRLVHASVALFRLLKGSSSAGDAARQEMKRGRSPLMKLYYAVLLLDYGRHLLLRVVIPLWRGQTIIADRYVYDVATTIGLGLGWELSATTRLIDGLLRLFPRPSLVYYLDVPLDVAFSRKHDIPSIEFLQARKVVYDALRARYGMACLDATLAPETLAGLIEKDTGAA